MTALSSFQRHGCLAAARRGQLLGRGPGRIRVAIEGEQDGFETLIQAGRNGERPALDKLFSVAQEHFSAWIKQHPAGPRFDQRYANLDLFQDGALRALERFSTVRATSLAEFLAWFDEILAHKIAELLRHDYATKKRDPAREIRFDLADGAKGPVCAVISAGVDPSREAEDRERERMIRDALDELSERDRSLIELRFWHGMSYEAIADNLAESPEAVRSALRRLLARLAERLRFA